jgi:hypothetical protein
MYFGWPQITLFALLMMALGISMKEHGNPKSGAYNAWITFFAVALELFILYSGGFFSNGS